MEIAKITSKGQITIPIGIRKKLGLNDGDKVLFLEEAGKIAMLNATMAAVMEAQAAFTAEEEEGSRLKEGQDMAGAPGAGENR